MTQLADLRKNYTMASLQENEVDADPIKQFSLWFEQAIQANIPEPNVMTLATANAKGIPSARIMLLKGIDARGFIFFTNYLSRKGQELQANPFAALLFHWIALERQVRIEGNIEKLADHESDHYFHSRPLGSRIGAWASEQSQVIPNRAYLEQQNQLAQAKHGENPARPPHWGGFLVKPEKIEFWQGGASRLHDRLLYTRHETTWQLQRLAP